MLNRKSIAIVALASMLSVATGTVIANQFVFATEKLSVATPFGLVNVEEEEASLLVEQIAGSNQVKLCLQLNEEYTKSITSLDLRIKLEPDQVNGVTMVNDSISASTEFRYSYDDTTGILRILLVGNEDLVDNQQIPLGTFTLMGKMAEEIKTSLKLDELQVVDLLHSSNMMTVDRTEHEITVTPSAPPVSSPDETPGESEQPTVPSVVKVASIKLNKASTTVKVGKTLQLTAKVLPTNATNSTLKWKSSNTSVAKVSANGKVTAVGKGTATITATSTDGSKVKATATIKVENVKVTSVKLSKSSATLLPKETLKLNATIKPSNATNQNLVWTSSNTKVATVTKNGKVTAKATGTATITAKTKDGSKIVATCKITVSKLKLNVTKATIKLGKTLTLVPKVYGKNQTVTFSSSNKKVATVTSKGKIKAKKKGNAIITVKANGVTKKVKITIT